MARTFDICHGCRMCFKYCPSFPSLFAALDGHADGDVNRLTSEDKEKVVGECYQCKICYVKCPYTDRDGHAYNLDYPALMQRAVHVRVREKGVPLRDKVLQNADLAGKSATGLISKVANYFLKSNFHRAIAEAVIGIHKKKLLPEFHTSSFFSWFRKRKDGLESSEKVVLFATCFVNYNNPAIGVDAVRVLEKNDIEVKCPSQNCCGMPGLNTGDLDWAVEKMKANVESLYPYARDGYKILAINPTCSLTMKKEYRQFLPPEWREKAGVVADAVLDFHEYLFERKKEGKFNRDFKSSPGSVALHLPCHLRAQNIGYRSRDIVRTIPGTKIGLVEECCGHNGTWAMKKEYFELSLEAGKRAFEGLSEHKKEKGGVVATDCPLAAIQIEQGASLEERPLHPIQIVARAYLPPDQGGFEHPVQEDKP